jgi:hypothetical protein
MTIITVKDHEIQTRPIRDSYDRRALQFKNNIIETLSALNLTEDDIEIELPRMAMRRQLAECTWWIDGYRLFFSYNGTAKYVENLFIVWKVLEAEIELLRNEQKTFDEFVRDFTTEEDSKKNRREARQVLGVEPGSKDWELIHKNYKKLAVKHHPDMGGDLETFKKINNAHKVLKRELA